LIRLLLVGLILLTIVPANAQKGGSSGGSLVYVDSVRLDETGENLIVMGNLPDGCTSIIDTSVNVADGTLNVEIITERPEAMVCTQALVPFEVEISLTDVELAAGEYSVTVNGETLADTITVGAASQPASVWERVSRWLSRSVIFRLSLTFGVSIVLILT